MRRLKRCSGLSLLLLGSTLFLSPCFSQTDHDISVPEFRQAMFDYATLIDSIKGTAFASQLQSVPDSTYAKWYGGVPNGRQFKEAVNVLVARRAAGRLPGQPRQNPNGQSQSLARRSPNAAAQTGSPAASFSPMAGISDVKTPDYTLFSPGYADSDPSNPLAHWESMVHTLQDFGAMPGGSYASLNATRCDADAHAALSVTVSTFHGIKDAADAICDIVPDVLVVILGEGTTVPAKEICFGVTLVITVFNSAAEGILADCEEVTGDVNSSEAEASWHNSISLYNLKLRLKIEQNLANTAYPMGLFELPSSLGGYLEISRAVVKETIDKMTAAGQNVSTAASAMAQGDTLFAAKSYKAAYKQYQKAYLLAAL